MSAKSVAVIGLGSMGMGMAQSMVAAEIKTYGFDIDAEREATFQEAGGSSSQLESIAADLDIVAIVVLNAQQTETVLFGENGLAAKLKKGAVVLACATVAPEFAQEMATRCEELGVHYLDAPISGGATKAANGELTIMASGSKFAFERAQFALDAMAERVFDLGENAGSGSAMKAVNQLLAGVHIAAMGEAMVFGLKQGLKPEKILEIINVSAGASWMFSNRAPHLIEGDYAPRSAINIWPKDLGIISNIAQSHDMDMPIASAALMQFLKAAEMGLGGEDDAAVAKVYAQAVGVELPGPAE